MKLSKQNPQNGAVILVIIVLVFLLLFLGYTLWEIWKMLQKVSPAPANQSQTQTQLEVQAIAGQLLDEFLRDNTNQTISTISTQVVEIIMVTPFIPTNVDVRIYRSTNLIDWNIIATNSSGESWSDSNPPWPNAFYKQEVIK